MSRRIGLFGGTFDPPHWGHINLALELKEKRGLDEVWFLPAHLNPHKEGTTPAGFPERLEMVKLAVRGIPSFIAQDIEGRRPPPSYAVETIRACLALSPEGSSAWQFYWLMGSDSLASFIRWHEYEEIISLVPILIGARWSHSPPEISPSYPAVREVMEQGFTPTRLMDIDSTEVRRRLAEGLYCGHLVPPVVLDYIDQRRLYSEKQNGT